MASYSLPHFGEIDPQNLEECYDVEAEFKGRTLRMDLNFEGNSIDTKRLAVVKKFIEGLEKFDVQNKKCIEEDYADEDCDTIRTYVEHHLEEIEHRKSVV